MIQIEVVAAIIRKDDKIFATQRGYGEWKDWWESPGGKMETGEICMNSIIICLFCRGLQNNDYLCGRIS